MQGIESALNGVRDREYLNTSLLLFAFCLAVDPVDGNLNTITTLPWNRVACLLLVYCGTVLETASNAVFDITRAG